jgi:hypothetical protein
MIHTSRRLSSTRNVALIVLSVWLAIDVILAANLAFDSGRTPDSGGPYVLGLAVVMPVIIFGIWYTASPRFREFVLALDPRHLTLAQTWRIGGFVFLALAARGVLPHTFANIAGGGDIFFGATAAFAAYRLVAPQRFGATLIWQAMGMMDLVTAIALGALSSPSKIGFLAEGGVTTRVMGLLPMSLVPTFIVPLLFIFHIIVIAQARRWPRARARAQAVRVA